MDRFVRVETPKESWPALSIADRLSVIRRLRRSIAADPSALAVSLGDKRVLAETLAIEVMPLLAGARFLERRAASLLAPRRLGPRGRPAWLWGVAAEVRREPWGAVLIVGPGNYPLFLPGAQVLQALAAGNSVAVKPALGCAAPMHALAAMLRAAGLPNGVLTVLGDAVEDGIAAVAAGYDRIVLTGSASTGRAVLAAAAQALTPCTMELSGNDPVFVLDGADLDLTAASVAYGLRLNDGATCIAPRKLFARPGTAASLERRLVSILADAPVCKVAPAVLARVRELLAEARAAGARVSSLPHETATRPIVVAEMRAGLCLLNEDIFAPILSIVPVPDEETALAIASACPYALGASVFGPEAAARRFALRVRAGGVVINDVIVPTADPRVAFGGVGASGFGVTRGAEGLLEMTVPKAIFLHRGRLRAHLDPRLNDAGALTALIGALYGTPADALRGVLRRRRNTAQSPTARSSGRASTHNSS